MTTHGCAWIDRAETVEEQIRSHIDRFESDHGLELHWVARHHLINGSGQTKDPFPRIEEHQGYLFGIVYVPSNELDTLAEFDEVVFISTHDDVIGTYRRGPRSTTDWPASFEQSSSSRIFRTSDAVGGQNLVRILKTVVSRLLTDAEHFSLTVAETAQSFGLSLSHDDASVAADNIDGMNRKERRRMQLKAEALRSAIAAQRKETPLMRRVIVETESMLQSLATDVLDLTHDAAGAERILFTRELEIFVSDIYVDARHTSSVMSDIDDRLSMIADYLKQLKDDANVSANRFTGAIASIMLLPTFIVGLYGQNFGHIPELTWKHGYMYSWATILAVTIGQVWFFKRRKWL